MEIRQLKYFLEIAQVRNYSMAAERLYVSQPALSSSIKQLEREIGEPVFVYKNKTLSLTPAGMDLLGKTKEFMESYHHFLDSFQKTGETLSGRIRLGITQLLANSEYIPNLVNFIQDYPNINLALREEGSSEVHNLLINNKIDIGLVVNPTETPVIGVTYLPSIRSKKVLVCRKNHPIATLSRITFDSIRAERFVELSERFSFTSSLIQECLNYHFTPNILLKCTSKELIRSVLMHSDLVAILPEMFLSPDDYASFHVIHVEDSVEEEIKIGLIYKKGYNYKPGTLFMNYLEERMLPSEATL